MTILSASDPTVGFRRFASAAAGPLAILCIAYTNASFALLNPDRLSEEVGAEAVHMILASPSGWRLMVLGSVIGVLLLVPGVLATMRLTQGKLALTAGSLMVAGYMCYLGILVTNFDQIEWALFNPTVFAAFVDDAPSAGISTVFFLLFVVGNILGTALLAVAVIRSDNVPSAAGWLLLGWPIGHVLNITLGNEWFAVAGGALELVGFCIIAAATLRTSDSRWVLLG